MQAAMVKVRVRRRALLGALLAVAVTCQLPAVAAPAAAPVEPLPRVARVLAAETPLKIVAFGSSSTEGVGATSRSATYPSRLAEELSARLPQTVTVLNRGVGGEDSDDMTRRLPSVLAEQPDLVIWQTGSNDTLRGVPMDRFMAQTRAGVTAIRAAGADVMLMEPQLCARLSQVPEAEHFRDALRDIGAEMGVPVIRRYDLMHRWLAEGLVTRAALLSPDGLHMADAGYALLAKAVAQQILTEAAPSASASAELR
jgi:lysophospholipase L1-like esterase